MVVNTNQLREINIELVRQVLRNKPTGTKNSLSKDTGLSVSSCRNILEEMLKTGEVIEKDLVSSNGGRPSRGFLYNKDFLYVGIIYFRLEGSKQTIYYGVLNSLGETVEENSSDFDQIIYDSVDEIISYLTNKYTRLNALSIGVPGVVVNGKIELCDVKKLSYFPIKEVIESKYNLSVVVENDVNSCVLGYYHTNIIGTTESSVYIYFPVFGSPGTGIVINGKVLRGDNNFAGEVGFLPIGVEYKDQGKLQEDVDGFYNYVTKIILSINSILNPKNIVLSWENFSDDSFDIIKKNVNRLSVEGHAPLLTYNTNIHFDFMNGLSFLALKELSCKLEVVER